MSSNHTTFPSPARENLVQLNQNRVERGEIYLIGLCKPSGKHHEGLQGDKQGQRGFLEVQPALGSRKVQYEHIWGVKCPVLVHSVFWEELG